MRSGKCFTATPMAPLRIPMRGYEWSMPRYDLLALKLRIPMRGYEGSTPPWGAMARRVTNPHEGL